MKEKVQYIGSFYRQGNKVIFVNSQLQRTEAACSPDDTFDEFEGCRIALCRAFNKDDGTKNFLEGDFLCTIPDKPGGQHCFMTDGKIYHFTKGNAKSDRGINILSRPARTLEDLNNQFKYGTKIKFYKVN